jgi:hypothetical protein
MITFLALAAVLRPANLSPVEVDGHKVHPRNLLIKVDNPASLKRLEKETGIEIVKEIPRIGYYVVRAPEGYLQATRSKARNTVGVEHVEFDRVARVAYEPNDPYFPLQWSLPSMGVPAAWEVSRGNTPVTVAVIDTGVDYSQPDLANNIWTNTNEIAANGIDDDANGYIDDVHGYDFTYGDSEPDDVYGHGTACSSIIAATQDNNEGLSGVAPMARIMCIKASLDSGLFYDSATVPAYIYAADNGAKIFSCSFYADGVSQAEHDAIRYAHSKGVLTIVAAANENTVIPHYPAAYDEVVAVAAVAQSGPDVVKAGFSNFGSWVDVSAPGVGIHVIWGGAYISGSGTSFACPNVAGIAALLWSTRTDLTADEVRAAIEDTAQPMSQTPFGEISNYGFVNAARALNAVLESPAVRQAPAFRYMTPVGGKPPSDKSRQLSRILGRGFERDAKVVVMKGHRHLHVVDRGRTHLDFYNIAGEEPVEVFVDGELVASVAQPVGPEYMYPMIEAATQDASLTGGFSQALKVDGSTMDVAAHWYGGVHFHGTFARVTPSGNMNIIYNRHYTGTISGSETETVYLYDWSSWSYPYGNWVPLSTEGLPTSATTTQIHVPDAAKFVDFDGYVYIKVEASGADTSTVAHVDHLGLR